MDANIIYIIIGAVALVAGIIAGKIIFAKSTRKTVEEAESQAQSLLKEAEALGVTGTAIFNRNISPPFGRKLLMKGFPFAKGFPFFPVAN